MAQQAEPQRQGVVDEEADVLGDPLVRVVDPPGEAQAIEDAVGEPVGEVVIRQPAPPAELERLEQEHPQQHGREEDQDQDEDGAEGAVEAGRVILLQGVEDGAVRLVQQHVDIHIAKVEADDRRQERPCRPTLLAPPVPLHQSPDVVSELLYPRHASPPSMARVGDPSGAWSRPPDCAA